VPEEDRPFLVGRQDPSALSDRPGTPRLVILSHSI
jgi:hypothetical protein